MIFIGVQPLGQRFQRSVSRRACGHDRSITTIFPVSRIIDEQKSVAVVGIFFENAGPIERERTVAAERKPESLWLRRRSGNIKRAIFRSREGVIDFDAPRRKRVDVTVIVRARMINEGVLTE